MRACGTYPNLAVSIALIPGAKDAIGRAAYLGAITTVFGHPGRRFGQMAEALILVVAGSALGTAWSTFGIYLGSLVIEDNPPAAYAIRGLFLAVVALIHGFLRSRTPRLFIFVLLMIIVSVVSLTSTAKVVTSVSVTQILYPILIGVGCIVLINISIFPEFSSRFLGQMTLDTLADTAKALENAGNYFIEAEAAKSKRLTSSDELPEEQGEDIGTGKAEYAETNSISSPHFSIYRSFIKFVHENVCSTQASIEQNNEDGYDRKPSQSSIKDLTDSKVQIRKKLGDCKVAQQECNFELAVSVLAPRDLKPLSVTTMKRLVAHTIAVISACESKFALLGSDEDSERTSEFQEKQNVTQCKSNGKNYPSSLPGSTSGQFDTSEPVDGDPEQRKLSTLLDQDKAELDRIRPKREIEFGDARLLRYLLKRVAIPYKDLHRVAARTIEVVMACIAYAYVCPR